MAGFTSCHDGSLVLGMTGSVTCFVLEFVPSLCLCALSMCISARHISTCCLLLNKYLFFFPDVWRIPVLPVSIIRLRTPFVWLPCFLICRCLLCEIHSCHLSTMLLFEYFFYTKAYHLLAAFGAFSFRWCGCQFASALMIMIIQRKNKLASAPAGSPT